MPAMNTAAVVPSIVRRTTVLAALPQERSVTAPPDFAFHASRADAPANARFRIAIDPAGAIRFCFMMESSGDGVLDEQARNFLQLCRVSAAQNQEPSSGLLWGVATILWGNDITPPAANNPPAAKP
jgi:hypothetical protein